MLKAWLANHKQTTRKEIADSVGISTVSLWRIAEGKQTPSLAVAVRIQELTGIPASELLPSQEAA